MNKLPSLVSLKEVKLWRDLASRSLESARECISYEQSVKLKALALKKNENTLRVIFSSPLDPGRIKEAAFITGLEIHPEEGEEEEILKAINAAYGGNKKALVSATELVNKKEEKKETPIEVSKKPTPQLLERLLERAIVLAASDIHFEPQKNHYQIRFRVHGLLQKESAVVTHVAARDLIRRIKILAKLDTTCSKTPQDGAFRKMLARDEYSLRVSLVPQYFGEKVVIRLFESEETNVSKTPFLDLGFNYEQDFLFKRYLGLQSGAIILSGPTGSGKTTLLYSALSYLDREWRNIISLEDPVEKTCSNINQVEFSNKNSELLRALLRQDPDVMMIGEVRDKETAETALSASLTGHLVLTTVHANNSLEVISRLLQLGLKKELLAISLKLIISQRLVQLNCPSCLEYLPAKEQLLKFFSLDVDAEVASSPGCGSCRDSGVIGRKGVFEFLPVSPEVITSEKPKKAALDSGYLPYAFSVRELLIRGEISPCVALRVLGMAPELMGY